MSKFALVAAIVLLALASGPARSWTTSTVPCDFVTGGGWILHPASGLQPAHANFGVAGGVKNGAFWGHLEYNDHGMTPPMQVHGTGATGYAYIDDTTRYMQGTCRVNGVDGFTYEVKVTDNGEPGRNNDEFSIQVNRAGVGIYTAGHWTGDGPIRGGNIQLHKGNASNTPPSDYT